MSLRYPLVAFDVDGTLVDDTVFIWKSMHEAFNTDPEARERVANEYFDGKIAYADWFAHDLKLLRAAGATRDGILDVVRQMRLMEGAEETLAALKGAGARLLIISGSIDLVVEHFDLPRWFDQVHLNRLEFDGDGLLTGGVATRYDVGDKALGLETTARRWSIPIEKTAFIGDNFNDVSVAKLAGFSIAFNCKSRRLAEAADVVVEGGDMRKILSYLID